MISADNNVLTGIKLAKELVSKSSSYEEYKYTLTNTSSEDIFIDEVCLFASDSLENLGFPKDSRVFRSGRHKNDMPGVCTLGNMDEAMKDCLSGMTESGDKKSSDGSSGSNSIIVSDHITVIGKAGNYLVISFVTGRNQMVKTEIVVDRNGDFVSLAAKTEFNMVLKAGKTTQTETIRVEKCDNAEEAILRFARNKAGLYGKRNSKHPAVFCTWYYYGLTVTYDDVTTNLKLMKERNLPFNVFQVDEGWEITLGEWEPNAKFPVPMKQVADEIREAGFVPGIWTSPFVAHETATVWKNHPEWILKDKEEKTCLFPMNDTVYYVFDITIKETWDYFRELYRKLTFDWGFVYHKLDFTRAAVIYPNAAVYDNTVTITECYYEAVKAIREGMGEDSYFLMCGGLYDPIIGLVDAQRTGSDVLSMWSSNINKDGKTAPYTIKQSLMRFYMNEWWNNDPDALMVRRNLNMERNLRLTYGLLNDEEVKTSVINQFIGGGIMCSTEPLDKIEDDRLYEIRRILPVVNTKVRPLDIMNSDRFPENVLVTYENDRVVSVARINWSDESPMELSITLSDAIIGGIRKSEEDEFVVCDYYGKIYHTGVKANDTVKLAPVMPHGATVIKIERVADSPIIVKSTGHFSMGEEIEKIEIKDNEASISTKVQFDYPTDYAILSSDKYFSITGRN